MSNLSLAFKSFFSLLFGGKLPEDVMAALNLTRRLMTTTTPAAAAASKPGSSSPAPAKAPEGPTAADGAVQILAILQREARLIDFLQEDIGPYTDDQVGAAVRDIHKNSRAALERHFTIKPVVDGVEGTNTNLATAGLDAKDTTRLRIVGKVPADGKVDAGVLRHRGWRIEKIDLPTAAHGKKAAILAPAEIEVE
ncbi:MAG: DUF2760 domain-containing protein [Bryobacterales bacterium]|nr:DUF2760 domain-containing protein [Bryobacterales bacterium]